MKAISLFSGAGGGDLGLEAAGIRTIALCEIEPHARAVLRKHWPDVTLLSDVRAISGGRKMKRWMRERFAGRADVLVGGSPCQDLSIAGKRAGLGGARSSLFFRQVRLWKILDCPYILWENVLGAFSSNHGRDFAAVLSALVGAAVPVPSDGWSRAGVVRGPTGVAAWRVLDAQFFGVPQRRRRVFVLGARAGGIDPAEVLLDGDGVCGDSAAGGEAGEGVAADARPRVEGGGVSLGFVAKAPAGSRSIGEAVEQAPTVTTHTMGMAVLRQPADAGRGAQGGGGRPTVVVRTFGINNDSRAEAIEEVAPPLRAGQRQQPAVCVTGEVTHALTHEGADASEDGTGRGTPIVVGVDQERNPVTNVMGPLNTGSASGGGRHPVVTVMRQREGKPGGGKGPLLSAERSLTLGTTNDQVVFPAAWMVAFGEYVEDGTASAIKARDHKDATDLVYATGRPRRLMPVECERLMGWPDGHTAIGIDEQGREYALKDTPRYKLCGNGIASPVIEWIGWRLMQAVSR